MFKLRLETTDAQPRVSLIMHHPVIGGHVEHLVNFHIQGTSGLVELPESFRERLFCHVLLSQLPDKALPEALESLGQMWQFYHTSVPAELPSLTSKSVPARVSGSHVALVVPISEE